MTLYGDTLLLDVMDNVGNRRFGRTDFNVKGFIDDDGECPVSVVNISLKGILVSPDREVKLEKDRTYPLRISLSHSEIDIITEATLMHEKEGQFGFRFDSVEADGMIHLRRLLELNLSSDEQIEKELEFLVD